MLKQRALSALVAISIVFLTFYFSSHQGLAVLSFTATLLAIWEYSRFFQPALNTKYRFYCLVYLTLVLSLLTLWTTSEVLACIIIGTTLPLVLLSSKNNFQCRQEFFVFLLIGVIYCSFLPAIVLKGILGIGSHYFFGLITISFSTDTFAYFSGKAIGGPKLAPLISPSKTLSGAFGGLIGGTLLGTFYLTWAFPLLTPESDITTLLQIIGLCLSCSIASQIGDLFQSSLKRKSKIKDSGSLLPGHGGIYDRIDGVLFAGPILYFGLNILSGT